MRRLLACWLLLAAPAAADCLLGGTVVDGATHKPLSGTKVYARWRGEPPRPAVLRVTDASGAFCFEKLPAGDYGLVADHMGYLTSVEGGNPGRDGGTLFAVGRTELQPVRLMLLPFASVSGTVVDSHGQPVPEAQVSLQRKRWSKGWILETTDSSIADESGAFRLPRVAPGTCYLQVDTPRQPRSGMTTLDENGHPAYPAEMRTYYPGSVTQERAAPIALEPGRQIANLTVAMIAPTPRRISGHVSVSWTADAHPTVRFIGDSQVTNFALFAPINPDGSFTAENLYPAKYTVVFQGVRTGLTKQVDVTMGDADGVVLEPHLPEAPVRVVAEPAAQSRIQSLRLLDLADGKEYYAQKGSEDVYAFQGVTQGRYRLQARSQDVFVQSVLIDGRTLADTVIEVPGQVQSMVHAVLSNAMARIEATVDRPQSTPTSPPVTVVWEDEANSINDVQGDSKAVPQSGIVEARSLAPGKYRLFAIEGFDDRPWGCPELAAALKEKSVEVEVSAGEWRKVTVPVISFSEWTAALHKVGM
ncbi:MAG TPA: carboxypeptidase regulatory-like domain-containing protein [Bryobacteraceae bacterium]|nr:carboxypeptidase regulatory-like domain-containing protein [Bryobacteraceae bacterium]